jgi:hypothetical protein
VARARAPQSGDVRLGPPLIATKSDIDELASALDAAFATVCQVFQVLFQVEVAEWKMKVPIPYP